VAPSLLGLLFPLLGKLAAAIPGRIEILTDAIIGGDFNLRTFSATVKSSEVESPWLTMNGAVVKDSISITVREASGRERALPPIRFDAQRNLASFLTTPLAPGDLAVGRAWRIETINPLTAQIETATAKVLARETMNVNGSEQEVYVVEIDAHNLKFKTWMTQTGDVIKQEAPFGITLLREERPPAEAPESQEKAPAASHDRN
jgi:hypothetical protein